MSAVLLAVFNDFGTADQVRTRLVRDGFPTDRVELTARGEPGRAGLQPGGSSEEQFRKYYCTLLSRADEREFCQALAQRVQTGTATTIAVHPRGDIETQRAAQILEGAGANEVVGHDLEKQSFEQAAARSDGYWVRHFMPDNPTGADCIYCRLFPGHRH
ncbi:MAG: hypothetical protein JO341_02265 [Gammaproteobacteria bacterium]|nr:hypothetical protein [Gammaproteobacteria bacterium]MBV9619823.1 hypothetical protein [Gammaproteobacteria bacterium]